MHTITSFIKHIFPCKASAAQTHRIAGQRDPTIKATHTKSERRTSCSHYRVHHTHTHAHTLTRTLNSYSNSRRGHGHAHKSISILRSAHSACVRVDGEIFTRNTSTHTHSHKDNTHLLVVRIILLTHTHCADVGKKL